MGNSLTLPCVCHCCHGEVNKVEAGAGGAKRKRRKQRRPADCSSRSVRAARPRHVVPVVDAPEHGDGGREREAWPECRVEPAGHGEDGGVRVRIVMKRKDIAQLVARLEQRGGAGERNAAGMGEAGSSIELDGCNGNGRGGGVTMSPCRGAWSPRLSIIPENY